MLDLGSGGRTRTYNLVVNSHPLCLLSYTGLSVFESSREIYVFFEKMSRVKMRKSFIFIIGSAAS